MEIECSTTQNNKGTVSMEASHILLSWATINSLADDFVSQKNSVFLHKLYTENTKKSAGGWLVLYGIPRGGVYAAQAIRTSLINAGYKKVRLHHDPRQAHIFIDDIIDSGETKDKYARTYSNIPFHSLINKKEDYYREWGKGAWIVFPWEQMDNELPAESNITRILESIGEDPNREGLKDTPKRVIKSYQHLFGGYKQDPKDILTIFKDDTCDEMVLLKNIEFYSTCEHHILPFYGKAHIAYVPNGNVIGISKLARLLEIYSRRLQIQERLCQQITQALDELLKPKGSACILEAQHLCMVARGVQKQNSTMVTSSLTGVFNTDHTTRSEFMELIK